MYVHFDDAGSGLFYDDNASQLVRMCAFFDESTHPDIDELHLALPVLRAHIRRISIEQSESARSDQRLRTVM